MTQHFLERGVWQKIYVFTINRKNERIGRICIERTKVKSGEYAGMKKLKCLIDIYDKTKPMAIRLEPIHAIGQAIGGNYDLLTSCIGAAMLKTRYAKYFKAETEGGGNIFIAFDRLGYKLDRII